MLFKQIKLYLTNSHSKITIHQFIELFTMNRTVRSTFRRRAKRTQATTVNKDTDNNTNSRQRGVKRKQPEKDDTTHKKKIGNIQIEPRKRRVRRAKTKSQMYVRLLSFFCFFFLFPKTWEHKMRNNA